MDAGRTDWWDGETRFSTGLGEELSQTIAVPCLTILAHSDGHRVGERLELPVLAAGGSIPVSRLEPIFPAGASDREALPLAERHLSRRPIRLRQGSEPGSLAIERDGSRTRVVADGQNLDERLDFSAAEIANGVVIELGTRVVVLLYLTIPKTPEELPSFGLVGASDAVVRLRREIRRLAGLDVPVLLRGATGTGKELAARALHDSGPRSHRPWMAVNMGAVAPSLAAAELFGATRGAFTGADRRKDGVFQKADGGTLFLDEIGETPPEVQVALLRALESGEIRSVGSTETKQVDVRVIAATDADLEAAIEDGRFRAPLLHRLAGYSLHLPTLAARRDDIGRLLGHFLAAEGAESKDDADWPPAAIVARLARYDWPGNVRELRNVARRMAILGPDATPEELATEIDELLLGPSTPAPSTPAPPTSPAIPLPEPPSTPARRPRRRLRKPEDVSDEELVSTLRAQGFNLRSTADALGLSPVNLYRRMDECPDVRKASDLGREEIDEALRSHSDIEAAAAALEVSLQGLKRRMTALGLKRG